MLLNLSSGLRVQEITDTNTLEALESEWELLWRRCPGATPFQSPHWLLPWWKYFGGSGLWCLALRSDNVLNGFAPLFIWNRKLMLVGTGISDYLDVLLSAECLNEGLAAMLSVLRRERHRWDECDMQQLPAHSVLCDQDAAVQDVCPVLGLSRDLPMLKKAEYYRRHASRIGELCFESVSEGTFEHCYAEFLRLHRLRWRNESVLDQTAARFHHEVAFRFLRAGMLRLYLAVLNNQTIAAWYGFESKGCLYYYLGGFDPAFEKLSPGTMLIAHAIQEARECGVDKLDFLRGQERYKYSWGAHDTFTYRRQSV